MSDQIKSNEVVFSPEAETNSPRYLTAPKICHNPNCSFQTHEPLSRCPKCRRPIWTTNEFRLISSIIVFCGFFLLSIGGGLGYIAYRNYAPGGRLPEGYEAGVVVLTAIAGFISLFGSVIIAVGAWQVLFGKANRRLIFIFLMFLLAMLLIIGFGRLILLLLSEF
ncbi:MAG TPA: hypothetical protein VF599_05310 [Pyrinomonadaceae bacterium]|jgi:hypothetical protein